MTRAFLEHLEAYRASRTEATRELERRLLEYLAPDYSMPGGPKGWRKAAKALGVRNAESLRTGVGQTYRAAYRYLNDPEYHIKALDMVTRKGRPQGYLIGVRLLAEAGVETWAQLEKYVAAHPVTGPATQTAGAVPVVVHPEPPPAPEAAGVTTIRRLFHKVLEEWAVQAEKVADLEGRVATLEQTKRSQSGEIEGLEALIAEMESDRREVAGALAGSVELPARPTLDATEQSKGKAAAFEYKPGFRARFEALKVHEKRQVVKALERIHHRPTKKLRPSDDFNVPDGTLSSRAALKWRIHWRPADGKIRVYDLVPKAEYTERRHR